MISIIRSMDLIHWQGLLLKIIVASIKIQISLTFQTIHGIHIQCCPRKASKAILGMVCNPLCQFQHEKSGFTSG